MKKQLKEEKWKKLLNLVERFKHIPYVDFVIVAGSMATGKIHNDSDFDLIIGSDKGRIFTTRLLTIFTFQITGDRRKASHSKSQSKDKICLNHFVTKESYKLSPPHNKYWKNLYNNLVPVYGDKLKIEKFFSDNSWAGDINIDYKKWIGDKKSFFRKFLELMFFGLPGDIFEKIVKTYQIKRIERNLEESLGHKPQVQYNDNELRFHMDTKRIDEYLKNEKDFK